MKHSLGTFHQQFFYKPFQQKVLEMEMEKVGWYKVIVYLSVEGYILDTIWDEGSWDRFQFEGVDSLKKLLETIKYEPVIDENENIGNYLPAWVFFQPIFIDVNHKQKINDIILDYIGGIDENRLKEEERKTIKEWMDVLN